MADQKGLTIRKVIVDCILLRRQLAKEQLGQIRDTCIFIFNALGHFAKLAFHLDHPVQDQMSQDHERILLDDNVAVREALVQLVAVLVDDVTEGHSDVSQRDDNVTADIGIPGGFEDFEQQPVVLVAELRTNTEELAE